MLADSHLQLVHFDKLVRIPHREVSIMDIFWIIVGAVCLTICVGGIIYLGMHLWELAKPQPVDFWSGAWRCVRGLWVFGLILFLADIMLIFGAGLAQMEETSIYNDTFGWVFWKNLTLSIFLLAVGGGLDSLRGGVTLARHHWRA